MFNTDIQNNIGVLKTVLNVEKNFDIVCKESQISSRNMVFIMIDGFLKDAIYEKMMEFFLKLSESDIGSDIQTFSKGCVPYGEVSISRDIKFISAQILSGVTCMIIDGFEDVILIDIRTYPQRDTSEPDKDKSLRGSRDGFVETLISNVALIRRRIRSTSLCIESVSVGSISKTDIALCYMSDRADIDLLNKVKTKLNTSEVAALTVNTESIATILVDSKWYNPYPKFKYTERPDSASAQILDGNIVILVDNSPVAMMLPVSIFDIMEEANDFYFPPMTGAYLRLCRYATTILALILTPLWLLLTQNPQIIPSFLSFIIPKDMVTVPIFLQLIILEFAIDGMKLATLNTPSMLSTPLSVISGIVVGDFAVKTGWFNGESLLYMAFVMLSSYNQPNLELIYALKFSRILLLVLTAMFNIIGFFIGLIIFIASLVCNKTVSGQCYLYPLIPFNYSQLKQRLFIVREIKK